MHVILVEDTGPMDMKMDTKPKDPVFEGLNELFEQVDSAFHTIGERHPREFACKKGCSDCCYAFFDVSYIEALAIKRALDALPRHLRREITKGAQRAQRKIEGHKGTKDPSRLRIRCPLLSKDRRCLLYGVRPINCRTYGVPTEFGGSAHVCPKSGFELGTTYTTLHLGPIQERLLELSLAIGGTSKGAMRLTIPQVVLTKGDI